MQNVNLILNNLTEHKNSFYYFFDIETLYIIILISLQSEIYFHAF